ncbi:MULTISPECIES: TonB family protein [Campylobacter]|uniref:energy transducer TonB family protein n=1 Tax=Campylobacter TaxID=194 RepID=UPI001B6BD8CE|nr:MULTISPECIES: TonB family protein [Campylobacter]MBP3676037.1 TonB family protein [Campylobacter sp.]MBQ3166996.1 TonB family protein [Campylobacter sp.]MBQ7134931.1 TonB family protein [Campylobacter sp.]MBR2159128.1 TonB family protein [Campylobacter sp.]MDL0104452.1 TonB family protein [Campylobacter ovis]
MTRVLESSKIQSFCLTSMLFIPFIWFGLNILKPIVPSISTQSISLNQIIQIPAPKPVEPAPKPIEKIEPIQKPKEIIKPKPTPKPIPAKPVPTKAKPAKTTPINSQPAPAQPAPAQQTQQIESFNISSATNHPVLAAIKSAINKNHIYPRAAKRLKQQGEVLVEFIWTKDMELKSLKILKASKHKALNDAAIATITAAAKSFPKHDKTMQIQIPLVYKIN